MIKKRLIVGAILSLFILGTITSLGGAMNIFKNEFEQRWEELFRDVKKLNEYTATRPVELRKVKVSDHDIDGSIFISAKFINVEFESTHGQKSKFIKTIFKDCTFVRSNFDEAHFADVEFINCKFLDSTLSGSTMKSVRLVNCTMEETKLTGLDGTELVIEGGEYGTRTSFSFSGLPLKFKDAIFSGVNFMGMVDSCPLTIEGGLLSEVDFGKSHFSDVILRRVKQGEGGIKFNGITAANIRLENVELDGIGFMEAHAKSAIIVDSVVLAIGFSGGGVGKIIFRDSTVQYFDIAESMMPHVEFNSCRLIEPMLYDGLIKEFAIRDSSINNITGNGFKADIVEWDNVTLDGKIDLTNAQIKDFRPTRLKRGPRLQLITTGSNIRL